MPKSPATPGSSAPAPEPSPATPESFEKALERLEQIVKELESGDLPLEKSLELFEKGMALSESCRKQLSAAETRVEILLRKEGKVEAAPFALEDGESGNR
ncbi:MAG TPA: exodeoxyribonuclease VII small subunit [Bryobacterales bacterium]|nr:exodeoxyribonuclease VII small subunit [Bryobacterales bacterium]